MKSIAEILGSKPELNTSGTMGRYLSLVNYNINPITSAMFITSTASNPLIVSLIAKGTGRQRRAFLVDVGGSRAGAGSLLFVRHAACGLPYCIRLR